MLQGYFGVELASLLEQLARSQPCSVPGLSSGFLGIHPATQSKRALDFRMRTLHMPAGDEAGVGGAEAALLGPDAPSVATVPP